MLRFKSFEELLENEGLKKKAAKSGISYGTLKKVDTAFTTLVK